MESLEVSIFCTTCNKTVRAKKRVDFTESALESANLNDAISTHGMTFHNNAKKVHLEVRIIIEQGNES